MLEKISIGFVCFLGVALSHLGCSNDTNHLEHKISTDSDSSISGSTDLGGRGPASHISWITLEPGQFEMGSPLTEWGRSINEKRHTVEQVHRFEVAQTEITIEQWQLVDVGPEVVEMTLYGQPLSDEGTSDFDREALPVSVTSIEIVTQWLDALSETAGLPPCYSVDASWLSPIHCPGYRLPTESEWERAARGGDERATYNGDFNGNQFDGAIPPALEPIAWCGSRTDSNDLIIPRPVGQLAPNNHGLYDMIGNVSEWTLWEGVYSDGITQGGTSGIGTPLFTHRGGSYGSYGMQFSGCRAASRRSPWKMNSTFVSETGFRPVRTLPNSELPTVQTNTECAVVPPTELCDSPNELEHTILRRVDDGSTYVDIKAIKSSRALAVLGQNEKTGPFVETFGYSEISNTSAPPITLATPSPHLTATQLRTAADADDMIAVNLCDGDQCRLYHVKYDAMASMKFSPFEGGEIPAWIGDVKDMAYISSPLQIWVAGNGIARFDGSNWTQITAETSRVVTSLDVRRNEDGQTILAAAGEDSFLWVEDKDGWRRIPGDTKTSLRDVLITWNTNGWAISAVGELGTFIQGPIDDPKMCTLGKEDLSALIYPSTDMNYAIYTDRGALYVQPPNSYGLPSCLGVSLPPDTLAFEWESCGGMQRSTWYLTAVSIMGHSALQNGIHCTHE